MRSGFLHTLVFRPTMIDDADQDATGGECHGFTPSPSAWELLHRRLLGRRADRLQFVVLTLITGRQLRGNSEPVRVRHPNVVHFCAACSVGDLQRAVDGDSAGVGIT